MDMRRHTTEDHLIVPFDKHEEAKAFCEGAMAMAVFIGKSFKFEVPKEKEKDRLADVTLSSGLRNLIQKHLAGLRSEDHASEDLGDILELSKFLRDQELAFATGMFGMTPEIRARFEAEIKALCEKVGYHTLVYNFL